MFHSQSPLTVIDFKLSAVVLAYGRLSVPSSTEKAHQFTVWRRSSYRVAHRRGESCPACLQGCDANHFCLELNSQRSQEAVIEERQTEAQTGWWKTQRRESRNGTWLQSLLLSLPLHLPLYLSYLSAFFSHLFSPILICLWSVFLTVSLSFPFIIIQYD